MTRLALPAALLALTLLFFFRLAFTDRILARGDTFAYFYPYWHARDAALMLGELPMWTPHLFMGVPLLANSQLGTFYPPNWLVIPLNAPDAIRVSILLHGAWTLAGGYLLARRAAGLNRAASLVAAAAFALGGHVGAHVEQINQLQGLAWMPWVFLLFNRALARPRLFTPLLGAALALQFLSGHTQTVFITGMGLGVYGLLSPNDVTTESAIQGVRRRLRFVPILLTASAVALLLAAPQLLPTLEMTQHSNRRGGLNPNQATAFSFSPFAWGRGLLPSYDMAIYTEYIAYLGVIGLGLALVGVLVRPTNGRGWLGWAALAAVGLFLAVGEYNPVYWWLATLPGFNLFRVPARWLALFALGGALLAGMGLQTLMTHPQRVRLPVVGVIALATAGLAALSMLAGRTPELVPMTEPTLVSLGGWALALATLLGGLALVRLRRGRRVGVAVLVAGGLAELLLAAQALPYNDLAPREVYSSQRFTVSQLLAYQADEPAPGRVLSISNLYFDPGDRATLEARYAAMGLSAREAATAFTAIKMQETLASNLPLVWGIPSVDGFDGGLLPTAYYTAFTSLMLPEEALRTLDGRLREMLALEACRGACLPEQRWLDLTNTRYLITDKIYDVWHEDVAYDTQMAAGLDTGEALTATPPTFTANAIDVLYTCPGETCAPPVVTVETAGGPVVLSPPATAVGLDGLWLARLTADAVFEAEALAVRAESPLTVYALTLVDTRTGDFAQVTPGAWARVLSSDIKLYENLSALPRAFVVHQAVAVTDHEWGTEDALRVMREPDFDPAETVVLAVEAPTAFEATANDAVGSSAEITSYTATRVEVAVEAAAAGYLLLTDAWYPGWTATVNGAPAPLYRADVMFRAAPVPEGESTVVFAYEPVWLPAAPVVGVLGWGALAVFVAVAGRRHAAPGSRL